MDPQRLLEQFLGSQAGGGTPNAAPQANAPQAGSGGFNIPGGAGGLVGGLAAGGLLGVLVGNKKARKTMGKLAGGAVGLGGAAALGALAHHAYRKWQDQKAQGGQPAPLPPQPGGGGQAALPAGGQPISEERFAPSAAAARDGRPFELALVRAMIAAANADGHISGDEREGIVSRISSLPLDPDEKAFVFDALMTPPTLHEIAGLADGPEQAAEIYIVSRLAIDPDLPEERAYLDGLARNLALPGDLVAELEREATEPTPVAA